MVLLLDWVSWLGVACLILFGIVGYNGIQRLRRRNLYHPTWDAIQGGDEAKLKAAPPPTSLYDFWMDTITQEYILKRYTKLAEMWFGHGAGFDTRNVAHGIEMLGYDRRRSEINADIAEENFRASKAVRGQEKLTEKPQQPEDPKIKRERELREALAKQKIYLKRLEDERKDAENVDNEDAREESLNDYDIEIQRVRRRIRELERELASL